MRQALRLTPIRYAIIAAALLTAGIHLFLSQPLFLLNGLGYLALLVLFFWPRFAEWQDRLRWLLLLYTLVTIAGYFVVHADGSWQTDGLGLMTKVDEIILILLLLVDWQNPFAADAEV